MSDRPELSVNVESRRPGQVSLGVIGDLPGFAWVTTDEAREFAWSILHTCNDADDLQRGAAIG